jgi:diadenosine tetraphosphate (Ap4A) HIT family hydrolase
MQDILGCGQCQAIERWEEGDTEGLVIARTRTGYVTLFANQYFPGHALFVTRRCVSELHELGTERSLHLEEMARVAEAIIRAFKPRVLNHAKLGNQAPHLHWSMTPRYPGERDPHKSPWEHPEFWAALERGQRDDPSIVAARFLLLEQELRRAGLEIERSWNPAE